MTTMRIFIIVIFIISSSVMADSQKIYELSSEDISRLNEQRAIIEKYLTKEDLKTKYKTAAGKPAIHPRFHFTGEP